MNSKNGILLVNKEAGISSFDIIKRLRKISGIKRIGHCGTLDPFAEGLMIILLGKATKIASYLTKAQKTYHVKMEFGNQTNTGDLTGEIIQSAAIPIQINFEKLEEKVLQIKSQIPPNFSAIKIDGKRAYKLAKKDISFQLSEREIKIHNFKIIKYSPPYLIYLAEVSKGTYIRTLSEQIAEILSSTAYTSNLTRTKVSDFHLKDAISSKNLEKYEEHLKPLSILGFPQIVLNSAQEEKDFAQGKKIKIVSDTFWEDLFLVLNKEKEEIGFAQIKDNYLLPKIVFIQA